MAFTFFFRDLQTLNALVDNLLPFASGKSEVKIWDAGCASGQEPYSLALLLAEKMGRFAYKNVRIYGTDLDISDQFGKIIERGIYTHQELQRIPEEIFKKYFIPTDSAEYFQIVPAIRDKIIFKRENLLDLVPVAENISAILCKNVLLHQQAEERVNILKMFYKALLPGGFLAMEQTQKMPEELIGFFEQQVGNSQLYRRV